MINPEIVSKFSGPPGTGKSTTLLNVVDSLLSSGVVPEDIVFTTFTRAGADEARNRASERFNLPPQRLPYFRTLHSLCYQVLPKRPVMSGSDWVRIAKDLGLFFSVRLTPEDGIPRGHTKGDYLMSLWSLSRVLRQDPQTTYAQRDQWLKGQEDLTYQEFEHFVRSVNNYKLAFGRIDFTDMLEIYLRDGPYFHVNHVIIDEAQDLSALQWDVVTKICKTAKKVWIAGDDDQCIHEWNGASP